MFKKNFHFQERKSENSVKIHFLKRINLHDFGCSPAQPVLFTHCQKRDFEAKNRSVLSKILIGFSENPLELGEIGGEFRTRIFTAFSIRMGVHILIIPQECKRKAAKPVHLNANDLATMYFMLRF